MIKGNMPSRSSGIELLRICAMLSIIAGHVVQLCNWEYSSIAEKIYHAVFVSCHGAGVNVFFLITGFFSCKSDFNQERLTRVWSKVVLYSIVIAVVFWFTGLSAFSFTELIKTIFPVVCGGWTYVSIFVVVLMLQPLLNSIVSHLDKPEFEKALILLFLVLSVLPTLTTAQTWYSYLAWGCYLYLIGAYIRIYWNKKFCQKVCGGVAVCGIILITISVVGIDFALSNGVSLPFGKVYFTQKNSPLAFMVALFAFLWAKDSTIYSVHVNNIAKHTFGIYLFHCNRLIIDVLYGWLSKWELPGGIYSVSFLSMILIFFVSLGVDMLVDRVVCYVKTAQNKDKE